jgi:hypothetical protein
LAHARGNRVERSYDRGELLAKRARLMQAWADYLAKPAAVQKASETVVPMRGRS